MDRLVGERIADFFAFDQEELFARPVDGVEALDAREEIVVGEDEKTVAVFTVPPRDIVRRAVAVAVQRVRVGVAFVPAAAGGFLGGHERRTANGSQQDAQ